MRCVYVDQFTPTPPPEPGPEPPEPLPPEPTPQPPPAPNPDEPSAPWTDLSVKKTASPPTVVVGGVVTYRITVRNHGPNDATRVVLDDKPAAGAVVLSAHSSAGRCSVRQKLGAGGVRPRHDEVRREGNDHRSRARHPAVAPLQEHRRGWHRDVRPDANQQRRARDRRGGRAAAPRRLRVSRREGKGDRLEAELRERLLPAREARAAG